MLKIINKVNCRFSIWWSNVAFPSGGQIAQFYNRVANTTQLYNRGHSMEALLCNHVLRVSKKSLNKIYTKLQKFQCSGGLNLGFGPKPTDSICYGRIKLA